MVFLAATIACNRTIKELKPGMTGFTRSIPVACNRTIKELKRLFRLHGLQVARL